MAFPPPVPNRARDEHSFPESAVACVACGKAIDAIDSYCRFCGRLQPGRNATRPRPDAWYYNPVIILGLGLTVLGAFALPLVWRSPRMNTATKVVMGAVLVVYTGAALYLGYVTVELTLRELQSVMDPFGLM